MCCSVLQYVAVCCSVLRECLMAATKSFKIVFVREYTCAHVFVFSPKKKKVLLVSGLPAFSRNHIIVPDPANTTRV